MKKTVNSIEQQLVVVVHSKLRTSYSEMMQVRFQWRLAEWKYPLAELSSQH